MRRLGTLLAAILVVSCGPSVAPAPRTVPAGTGAAASARSAPITAVASRYGFFQVSTLPAASCTLRVRVARGEFGDGPPERLTGVAGGDGGLSWTYAAPPVPPGTGEHEVRCAFADRSGELTSPFTIGERTLDPRGFTVRAIGVDPIAGLAGVSAHLDPSLVAARDADVARLRATLATEWSAATRGLGSVTLVDANADIVVYVMPAKGTSIHALSSDGTQRVLLYAADEFGTVGAENAVAVALHELGHIWCCSGPDAGPDGHWKEKVLDPLLQGIDRYGLMTHPVTCLTKGAIVSCPNRFSERDLRAMGFTDIPPPPPDPCLTEAASLKERLAMLNAQLAEITQELDAIKARYPSLVLPDDVYARYTSLVTRYNALVPEANALVRRLNALPC